MGRCGIYDKAWRKQTMPVAKRVSKRKRGTKAVPVLGAAGLSLTLAGGASAAAVAPASDVPAARNIASQITLGEEEISDVSLSTFYAFDKENAGPVRNGVQLARGGAAAAEAAAAEAAAEAAEAAAVEVAADAGAAAAAEAAAYRGVLAPGRASPIALTDVSRDGRVDEVRPGLTIVCLVRGLRKVCGLPCTRMA